MKFRIIYTLLIGLFAIGINYNFSAGPTANPSGGDKTGSPVGNGAFCGQCHTSGAFSPAVEVKLLSGGATVAGYEPGKTYQLEITINSTAGASAYGVQAVALDGSDASMGAFENLPSGTKVTPLDGRNYFEHGQRLNDNVITVDWVAPASGSGAVTIYAAGIASNSDGGVAGDGAAAGSLMLQEGEIASTNKFDHANFDIQLLANPVNDILPVKIENFKTRRLEAQMFNLNGRVAFTQSMDLTQGEQVINLETGDLQPGIYFLQFSDGQGVTTKKVLKL